MTSAGSDVGATLGDYAGLVWDLFDDRASRRRDYPPGGRHGAESTVPFGQADGEVIGHTPVDVG
jgi:hypothetical protein